MTPTLSEAAQLLLDEALSRAGSTETSRSRAQPIDLSGHFAPLDALVALLEDRMVLEGGARTVVGPTGAGADPPKPDPLMAAELLYEDIVWLFAVNDGEGALISLERMLLLGEPQGEAREFVDTNTPKLLELYEGYMGPFSRTVGRGALDPHEQMPPSYLERGALAQIYDLVDGIRTVEQILADSPCDRLTTCAAIKQLERALAVEIH